MFGRKHERKRSTNILFVIFRFFLSMVMFVVLLGGLYTAFKHFSAFDPLKLDPLSLVSAESKKIPVLDKVSGLIAGKVPKNLLKNPDVLGQKSPAAPPKSPEASTGNNVLFKFLLVADSHIDNANLAKALDQARKDYPDLKFIIGLGDYSDVGTVKELKESKAVFDNANLRYFLIPGDHDLWDCRNRSLAPTACFKEVFGPNYQSFAFDDVKFLLLNNSDIYTGFDLRQLEWLTDQLDQAKNEKTKGILVFMHQPLYHPTSDHVMGSVEKSLTAQSLSLIQELQAAGVKQVFAGDIHYFSQYQEPRTGLNMVTIGAVTSDRNLQTPRFAVVSVLDDSSTKVEDVEIK